MSGKIIKIFGERNTGTNYLTGLIRENLAAQMLPGSVPSWIFTLQRLLPYSDEALRDLYFRAMFPRTLGWKHALVDAGDLCAAGADPKRLLFVTLTKNPYAWLVSMYRRPHYSRYWERNEGLPASFAEFLTTPWHCVARERVPGNRAEGPVELWNRKTQAHYALGAHFDVVNLRYEDLLRDPAAAVAQLAARAGIAFDAVRFRNLEKSAKGDARSFGSYQEYYLREQWRERLAPAEVAQINRRLDPAVVARAGYALLPDR